MNEESSDVPLPNETSIEEERLRYRLVRVLNAAAGALERCQVATDTSGAADEAAALLERVVTLNGVYVPDGRNPEPPTHFFCHDCKVVVPISYESASEVARHVTHACEYTRVVA